MDTFEIVEGNYDYESIILMVLILDLILRISIFMIVIYIMEMILLLLNQVPKIKAVRAIFLLKTVNFIEDTVQV